MALPVVTHVYADEAAALLAPRPHQQLFYDEAAGRLHQVAGYTVTSLPLPTLRPSELPPSAASPAEAPAGTTAPMSFSISAGAPVLLVRAAPLRLPTAAAHAAPAAAGGQQEAAEEGGEAAAAPAAEADEATGGGGCALTAVQRSARLIEFVDPATGNIFLESPADRHGCALRALCRALCPRFAVLTRPSLAGKVCCHPLILFTHLVPHPHPPLLLSCIEHSAGCAHSATPGSPTCARPPARPQPHRAPAAGFLLGGHRPGLLRVCNGD